MVSVYEEYDARRLVYIVRVGEPFLAGSREILFTGGAGNLYRMDWAFEVDRVPTATFRVPNPPPTEIIAYGSPVTFTIGEQRAITGGRAGTAPRTVFRGIVLDADRDEEGTTYRCVGRSWPLDVPYQKVLITIVNQDISIVLALLSVDAGIGNYVDFNMPAWQIGSVVPQTLSFGTYGEAIRKVIEPDDGHWWEDRVGNIHIRALALLPSVDAVRTYHSMQLTGIDENYPTGVTAPARPRIRKALKSQAARETHNRIFIQGASITTVNPDGTETSADIVAEVQGDSPYVRKPDGTQAYSDFILSNELIDTQVKADQVAQTYLDLLNILHEQVTLTIDGDLRVSLGETVEVVDPDYSGVVGNYVIKAYQTTVDSGDYQTVLTLVGHGVAPNVEPIAIFTYRVEREVFNDRVYAFVTFDASESYDPDGTIASYLWSDNQTPDIATGTAPVFTVAVDPAALSVPWEVTLTVEDNGGSTSTYMLTVEIAVNGPFTFNPGFTVAFDNNFSGTPNGGQLWYDQTGTSVVSTAVGDLSLAPGLAVFGTSAGGIWRTEDYCFTALTQVMANVGSPIVDLNWDKNSINRVWAIAQDGRVYRSDDAGLTWTLWQNLAAIYTSGGRTATITLRRMDTTATGIRVYGGMSLLSAGVFTYQPFISTDVTLSHSWQTALFGGEMATDHPTYPSDIIVADGAAGQDTELAIILNGSGLTQAIYFTDDISSPARWKRATGMPAKARGRYISQDLEQGKFVMAFDDTVIYRGDVNYTTGVMAITTAPAALDAGDTPNHILWVGDRVKGMAGVYLVSAEGTADGTVYKTFDRFATIGKIRPATGYDAALAGMNAKMAALGPGTAPSTPEDAALYVAQSPLSSSQRDYPRRVARLVNGLWELVSNPAGTTQDPTTFLRRYGLNMYRGHGLLSTNTALHPGQLMRSTDDGATWANTGPTPQINGVNRWGVNRMTRSADGTLYLVATPNDGGDIDGTLNFPRVYKSIDEGASWVQMFEDTALDSGIGKRIMVDITAHPSDPLKVFIIGSKFNGIECSWYSADAGATFAFTDYGLASAGPPSCQGFQLTDAERRVVMMSSGRVVELTRTQDIVILDPVSGAYPCALQSTTGVFASRNGDLIITPGNVMFAAGGSNTAGLIKRSTNGGTTWSTIVDAFALGLTITYFAGLMYDAVTDTLYIVTSSIGASQRVYTLAGATQLTVGTLTDITLNLNSLFTEANDEDKPIAMRGVTF